MKEAKNATQREGKMARGVSVPSAKAQAVQAAKVISSPLGAEALPNPVNDNATSRTFLISATPFVLRDPKSLARRQWVQGKFCCRGEISTTVAPGGVGKTSLSVLILKSLGLSLR